MMRKTWLGAAIALLMLAPRLALAQSTATPVVTGYLSTSGCSYGQTTCFVQFGSGGGGGGGVTPSTHTQTAAIASSLVVKASAGSMQSFNVAADSTLSGAAWWLMFFDATSAPADGAVTPANCYPIASGTTTVGGTFNQAFATGITVVVSTTGCFTKTASAHAFIGAGYQ